jgi:YD repeat-containing protein
LKKWLQFYLKCPSGLALGAERVSLRVDGVPFTGVAFPGWADNTGAWSADLIVGPGAHSVTADAIHPSGQYTSITTNAFTVGGTKAAITSAYDAAGNVTGRTWADGRVQTLTWDAQGRRRRPRHHPRLIRLRHPGYRASPVDLFFIREGGEPSARLNARLKE